MKCESVKLSVICIANNNYTGNYKESVIVHLKVRPTQIMWCRTKKKKLPVDEIALIKYISEIGLHE